MEDLEIYFECMGLGDDELKLIGASEMKVLNARGDEIDGYRPVCQDGAKDKFKILVNDEVDEVIYMEHEPMSYIINKIMESEVRHEIGVIDLGKKEINLYK